MNQAFRGCYVFGEFRLDGAERRLLRHGSPISLPPKILDTLLLLVENAGHLVEKDEFMKRLWPDTFVGEDALARNISILRKTLGESSDSQSFIGTVPTRGYRFVGHVQALNESELRAREKLSSKEDGVPAATAAAKEEAGLQDEREHRSATIASGVAVSSEPLGLRETPSLSLASKGIDQAPAHDSDSVKTAKPEEPPALVRKLFGSAGPKPYRLWEILHIKICLRSVLLVYLAWRFKNVTSGTWSLALFFAMLFCGTIQLIMAAALLYAGSMDREFLRGEARKSAPWFRAFGLANAALAISMAAWIAEGHTILAALIAVLGVAIGVTALIFKPVIDRAAVYDSNR